MTTPAQPLGGIRRLIPSTNVQITKIGDTLYIAASPPGGSGYTTIDDEGTPLTARSILDFQGAGVTASDGGTKTIVTIPGGAGGYALVQDEGTPLTVRTTLNFTGAGVTATDSGGVTKVDIPSGGGGGTFKQVTVNFGSGPAEDANTPAVAVVDTGVSATTKPVCSPSAVATADHDPDDYVAEGVMAYATNIQAGVGFDVVGSCRDQTWGQYVVNVTY